MPLSAPNARRRARDGFALEFGGAPRWFVRSPGRANLIGEHTDYNDGFVLPMAIDRSVWLAMRPCSGRTVRVRSLDISSETVSVSLDAPARKTVGWGAYVAGAAHALLERGHRLGAWEGVAASDLPIGAGVASSAALSVGLVAAFAASSDLALSAVDRALAAWNAETSCTGVRCGVMDPLIASCGVAGHALLVDCRTLSRTPVTIPAECGVVLLDTGVRRRLAASEYNVRHAECESAATLAGAPALRDVSEADLERFRARLGPRMHRRARHVVSENARVLDAVRAMQSGNLVAFGRLLDASHESLRDDFDVSCAELELMVRSVRAEPACYGARMMGGGFGGAVLALVECEHADSAGARAADRYATESGLKPAHHSVAAVAGAEVMDAKQHP